MARYRLEGEEPNLWAGVRYLRLKDKIRKTVNSLRFYFLFMWTRRYGPLHGPSSCSCGGLQSPSVAFFALWAQKGLIMLVWPIIGHFWYPVVTLVTFSWTLSNYERSCKKTIKIQTKISKISKNPKKSKNHKKNSKKNPKKYHKWSENTKIWKNLEKSKKVPI